ncbi:endonuclease III domain-containing protein [Geobacter argillaceus]|uniref:DNA-3-methyladenine glycosylase III n=1 Tax=Geobacter argillaceus TaxID=345631 RepID=A0A562VHY9_9BACT|nr:endonuclease III domain-containing protein [Geobacter argillaceus]TWJ17556.1 DNA-3-methyladenine glycosylase III [Geobacter argillaceus]
MADCMTERLLHLYELLLATYGPRHWWPAETPFEVCVGAILTQNTNWVNVEKAIANLKAAGFLSVEALVRVDPLELGEVIRPAGFFNVKSRRLKSFVTWLMLRADGSLEQLFAADWRQLRPELLAISGIGPETADSILLYAGAQPTFVVDAYTRRLLFRLGLLTEEDTGYEEVRSLFMDALPQEVSLFNEYHALIVQHCKERCRKRPLCGGCVLRVEGICRFGDDGVRSEEKAVEG